MTDDVPAEFLAMLDANIRNFGLADGLSPRLRDAVAATPRHRFVHRFRIGDGPLCDSDRNPAQYRALIYSDAVMRHVDPAGAALPSSNSEPSYVLSLLHMLALAPGQAVLEIGSGSGWLAAVMGRLVGPEGRVVGIELIPELAAQSRADLAAVGIGNVHIITGDAAHPHVAPAPYDRAMITAGAWDLPAPLFDQVAEAGLLLAPIELRSPDGCQVTLLRRQGGVFVSERAVPGWFVPLRGAGQDRFQLRPEAEDAPVIARFALPLGISARHIPAPVANQFRAFLARTEPDFITQADAPRHGPTPPFGIRSDGSAALWRNGVIESYGGGDAASRLARAYARWAALGLPGLGAFELAIHRAEAAPAPTDRVWIERRGACALAWSLPPDLGSWHALASGCEPQAGSA